MNEQTKTDEQKIEEILQDVSMFDPEYGGEQMTANKGTQLILNLIKESNRKAVDGFAKWLEKKESDSLVTTDKHKVQILNRVYFKTDYQKLSEEYLSTLEQKEEM